MLDGLQIMATVAYFFFFEAIPAGVRMWWPL